MGLLDNLYFGQNANFGGQYGGLLDMLRTSQMQQQNYQPSAGFPAEPPPATFADRFNAAPNAPQPVNPSGRSFDTATFDPSTYAPNQAQPVSIGNYQMPRVGNADQFNPQQALLPPNAQPAQGQLQPPQQMPAQPQPAPALPPALGGDAGILGRIGNPDGLIARLTGNDSRSMAKQNLKAQYDALVPVLGPQKAMLAVMNPKAGEILLTQALEKKQYGFQKMDDGTLVRTDPLRGTAEAAYGSGANSTGVAGPDGKIIPYPEGLDAAGRKTFSNEIARINADAAGGKKTEVQAKSEKFANLMEVAEKNLKGLENEGLSLTGKMLGSVPGGVGNYGQSPNFQKYTQAKNKFITSLLRDESGAAIGKEEFNRYEKELFPQPGDSPGVVAQKAENRRAAIEAMRKSAGPGYKPPTDAGTGSPASAPGAVPEGATATNPQTGQKLTFRNGKWQ